MKGKAKRTDSADAVRRLIIQSGALKSIEIAQPSPSLLMGRESIMPELSFRQLTSAFRRKTVLITGGGGSIGSELCRQIARLGISRLIILDIYENNAYELWQELRNIYKDVLTCDIEIASIRDAKKLEALFCRYQPHIVLHAAAHKHVPLMEANPSEAIKNNVFGTYNAMRAAEHCGAERFILVSTDKAVAPASVMGATKRFCELMLQTMQGSTTVFSAVRFGNVLGTSGSVLPLFQRQIARGGPLTLTDKRAVRYFMTATEAAQLVLHAAVMAKQSQVFVLDMGSPVNILKLAETLITLMGKRPYTDIAIIEEGLRPGEKLHESLLITENRLVQTPHSKIFIECQPELSSQKLQENLRVLQQAVETGLNDRMKQALQQVVPDYQVNTVGV
ncbi:MAG TPA: SDR family NAD(P)-dependent oxidoreductase [Clostridia bacterium]|nr:SDR family NAD(P)-dependent oxidoreductase [Clostridia bacterium]